MVKLRRLFRLCLTFAKDAVGISRANRPFWTREADTVAAKLQKEEQFKPWVTR